jgi:hypothetical protein
MTLTELLLIRGGIAPAELGLPDDVYDAGSPAGLPTSWGRPRGPTGGNPRRNAGRAPGAKTRPRGGPPPPPPPPPRGPAPPPPPPPPPPPRCCGR